MPWQPEAAPWTLGLQPGQARRLAAAPRPRWLRVLDGRLWLTVSQAQPCIGDDHWLGAGSGWLIEPGVEVVIEGWPSAELQLLEAWASVATPWGVGRLAPAR